MAVPKSLYAMLFFLITQSPYRSYGDQTEEFEKSINTLLSLQGLATGYPVVQDHYDQQTLNGMSPEDLQTKTDYLYDRLECGYLHSARSHMKLTAQVVFTNAITAVTPETLEVFSFDNQATMMIDSFLDPKPERLHDLWLLLLYTRSMRVFFRLIVNGDGGTLTADVLNPPKWLDEYVLSVLDKRIDSVGCAPDNYFDSVTARLSGEITDGVIEAIQWNKQLLHANFMENRLDRLRSSESLSYGSLWLFRDQSAFGSFVEEFLDARSPRVEPRFPPVLDPQRDFTAIDSLVLHQHRVMDTLKVLMLQITLSYANRLDESDQLSAEEAQQKFDSNVLTEFQHLMVLNDDTDFKRVHSEFALCRSDVKKCKLYLNNTVFILTETITFKSRLPEIKTTVTDNGDKSLDGILKVGKRLVEKIQKEIGVNTIVAVQSFLNVINETSVNE